MIFESLLENEIELILTKWFSFKFFFIRLKIKCEMGTFSNVPSDFASFYSRNRNAWQWEMNCWIQIQLKRMQMFPLRMEISFEF